MNVNEFEDVVSAGFRFASEAEPSAADVDEALARIYTRKTVTGLLRPILAAPATWLAVIVVAGGLVAVPSVRAALVDVAGSFAGYFSSDSAGPGHPLTDADAAPGWITRKGTTGQRALASAGGYDLYMVRERSGNYSFALDDSFGTTASARAWTRQFEDNAAVVLGPGVVDGKPGPVPLYGVTAANVKRVEVRYRDGGSSAASSAEGGFVALVDPKRAPVELLALDEQGEVLQSIDLTHLGWRSHVRAARSG